MGWVQTTRCPVIPSGKRTKNYGTSPFLMGKSTIYKWSFSIAMFVYQRVSCKLIKHHESIVVICKNPS